MKTYRGQVKNGVVILEEPELLPEGSRVEVALVVSDGENPTLAERYKDIIGVLEGLPADASDKHDHYLYGTPTS